MGGCLDEPKARKPRGGQGGLVKPIDATKPPHKMSMSIGHFSRGSEPVQPKKQFMTINELLTTYNIQQTLPMCSKMQGPKYMSNLVDGSSRILRVYNVHDIKQKRLQVYKKLLDLEVYQNEDGVLMILDNYYSGEDLYQLIEATKNQPDKKKSQEKLLNFCHQIYKIITKFHNENTWLGNLNFSSFQKKSMIDDTVCLVDFNFLGQATEHFKMGFAHRNNYESDYEFFGYLLQFLLVDQSPIFITHKIQYVGLQNVKERELIEKLLKGIKCQSNYRNTISLNDVLFNYDIALGYKFRRDVNKLLKMRKKRKGHNRKLYGDDLNALLSNKKFHEERVYHYESQRIMNRITQYIGELRNIHEEPFINYSCNNQSLKRFKTIFVISDPEKKIAELKQNLAMIK